MASACMLGAYLVEADEPQVSFGRCEADGVPIDQHENVVDRHEVGAVRLSMGYDDRRGSCWAARSKRSRRLRS